MVGDANFVAGNPGSPDFAVLVRHPTSAVIARFGNTSNSTVPVTLKNTPETTMSTLQLQVVQSPKDENVFPDGDVMMLVNLPLQFRDQTVTGKPLVNVSGALGQFHAGPVLIRNFAFASSADANTSQMKNWRIEADDFVFGTMLGFWVSGGHFDPVFYAYVNDPVSGVILYRRTTSPGWNRINVSGLLSGGPNGGPAFVNPYNTNNLYVLTTRGVEVSNDGGQTFQAEKELTALVTRSGKYSMRDSFSGFNGNNVIGDYAITTMGKISSMAFSRDDPHQVVAATPYAGLFYKNSSGKCTLVFAFRFPTRNSSQFHEGRLAQGRKQLGALL